MRYIFLLLLTVGAVTTSFAQALKLTKGTINEHIAISDSIKETFALYVPVDFDPNRSYKTLFLLDPDGNGGRQGAYMGLYSMSFSLAHIFWP